MPSARKSIAHLLDPGRMGASDESSNQKVEQNDERLVEDRQSQENKAREAGEPFIPFPQTRRWTSRSTSVPSLLVISALWVVGIVILEVLSHLATTYQGLFSVSQDLHYTWTYAPTFGMSELTFFGNF